MKCNLCKSEMLEGYIPTPAIEWIPKYASSKLIYKGPKEKGFRLGRFRIMSLKEQPAWYCPKCDIIIIDCNQNSTE